MGFFSKMGLFILSFIVFAFGVAVVVLASIMINKDHVYSTLFPSNGVFSVPIIILLVGLGIVLFGFLGCCGAIKENSCMLKTYAFIVAVFLIGEIVLGILILVYSNTAENTIKDGMIDVFKTYDDSDEIASSLDKTQNELKCCGVNGYKDWADILGHGSNVTKGCCKVMSDTCFIGIAGEPEDVAAKTIYTQGCYDAIKDIQGLGIGLGVACLILAVIQVMSISCACGLAKKSSQYA